MLSSIFRFVQLKIELNHNLINVFQGIFLLIFVSFPFLSLKNLLISISKFSRDKNNFNGEVNFI